MITVGNKLKLRQHHSITATKMASCKFFAQGLCRNGDSCNFIHERNQSTQIHFGPIASAFERLDIGQAATYPNERDQLTPICRFFMEGLCNKSDKCRYIHPSASDTPQQVHPHAISLDLHPGKQDEIVPQTPSDSRARVPCKFLLSPRGCQKDSCPYLHTIDGHEVGKTSSQGFELKEDEASTYVLYKIQN